MIVGMGVDVIEVSRIREKIEKNEALKKKIFSPEEIAYCEKQADPYPHYAGRFAAKEAFLKATGKGLSLGHELWQLEIRHDKMGHPELHGCENFGQLANERDWTRIHVSISHVKEMATAVVILEKLN